jgi:hypothetical protein
VRIVEKGETGGVLHKQQGRAKEEAKMEGWLEKSLKTPGLLAITRPKR